MKWILGLTFLMSVSVKAEVSPDEVDQMLNQMIKENVISEVEAQKARVRMRQMSPDQWKQINAKASMTAARSPASVAASNNVHEVQKIDLDGAQFKQIQDDMKKIVPAFKD